MYRAQELCKVDEVDVLAPIPFPNSPVVSVDVKQHLKKKKKRCTFGDERSWRTDSDFALY